MSVCRVSLSSLKIFYAAIAIVCAITFGLPVASADDESAWEIILARGQSSTSESITLAAGAFVHPGTTIETGPNGKVVLSRNHDIITVFPSSRMTVPARTGGKGTDMTQSFGTLLFRMESRETRNLEIRTPYLAAAVKGTTFTVSVDNDGAEVSVSEGSVQVTALSSGFSTLVGAARTASVDRGHDDTVHVSVLGEFGAGGNDGSSGRSDNASGGNSGKGHD